MVRLKGVISVLFVNIVIWFQFLMVRLKVILSAFAVWLVVVSIPYGTIKRYRVPCLSIFVMWFQFLMVRLKEKFLSVFYPGILLFQFLMVRLKALICKKNKSLILLPLRYYKDRKNKRIKCRCPIIMKCRFIDTILNIWFSISQRALLLFNR